MSTGPRFSIVIPTRNRPRTLPFTLRTCLNQDFDDFEIVVADNCSEPPVAQSIADVPERVRIVRSEAPLALSDNWESAVSHSRGEFVTVVGDDDGLLPGALANADRLIRKFAADVVTSVQAMYLWPDTPGPSAGRLAIPVMRPTVVGSPQHLIGQVAAFRLPYARLPMLYNSFVRRDVLERLRSRMGRLFADPIADVFSGFAVAWAARMCVQNGEPLGVAGLSSTSNGIATLYPQKGGVDPAEFDQLNRRAGLSWNPAVPAIRALAAVAAHSFQQAADRLFAGDRRFQLDEAAFVEGCVRELKSLEPRDWEHDIAALKDWAARRPVAAKALAKAIAANPNVPGPFDPLPNLGFDRHNRALILDTKAFGVSDVASAAALCESIFRFRTRPEAWAPEVEKSDARNPRPALFGIAKP